MSWFLSLILVGAVVTTGNNIPNYEYHNTVTAIKSSKIIKKAYRDETERFEKTYQFNPNGKIEVSNLNGSITVEAWDRPEIYLEATKIADSKERLAAVKLDINASQSNFRAKADYQAWKNSNSKSQGNSRYKNYGKLYVTFKLKVPRTAILDEIETVNGSVKVSNMTNYTHVSAVNGNVRAESLRGTTKLSTVNGTVFVDFDELERGSTISLGTVNGSVKLGIPSNANATVRADSVNGRISNEFGLPVRKGKYVGRDLYGRIGDGDVKIRLSSVNGSLVINNKDGGKTNPSVDLLKQKTSDDFDESFDAQVVINTEKMNKEISKAVSQATSAVSVTAETVTKVEIERNAEMIERNIEPQKRNQKLIELNRERIEHQNERDLRRIERDKRLREERIERKKQRNLQRNKRNKERNKRNKERIKRNAKRNKLKKERLKERSNQTERIEKSMISASETSYLNRRSPFMQEKTGSFEVKNIPKVVIDAEDCDVVVRGWDKSEVKYTVSRMSRAGILTKNLRTKTSNNKSLVEIEVRNDSPDANSSKVLNQVRVEVFVPKKSNLEVSSKKEIRLEGVSGDLELNGSEGAINVRDSFGKLRVGLIDGTIRVIGFNGEVETKAVDADIYLEGVFDKIKSESYDGTVYLTLLDDVNAIIFTNGEIDFESLGLENVIDIQKDKAKKLKIGKGVKGVKQYNFNFVKGNLVLRSKSSLSSD